MVYNFVVDMLGGSLPVAYCFIAYIIAGTLILLFSAVTLNFFGNLMSQFFYKS